MVLRGALAKKFTWLGVGTNNNFSMLEDGHLGKSEDPVLNADHRFEACHVPISNSGIPPLRWNIIGGWLVLFASMELGKV